MLCFWKRSKRQPRLFIISEFVASEENSTGYYWSKIINKFSHEITETYVICPTQSFLNRREKNTNQNFITFYQIPFNKNILIIRILGQLLNSILFLINIMINIRPGDVIFSGTNPSFLLFFISKFKIFLRFKWMLIVHDFFPHNLVAAGIVKDNSIFFRALKKIFDNVYNKAEVIIPIGRDMQLLLSKNFPLNKVKYIPNWVDPVDISFDKHKFQSARHERSDTKVVFQFFGNLGRVQGITDLLMSILHVKNKKASFVFVGAGASSQLVSNFIVSNPSINAELLPGVSFSENNEVLSSCDVAIVSLAKGMYGLAVPSKAYFSMAADKPILYVGDFQSELHMTIMENPKIGWFCEAANISQFSKLVDEICEIDLSQYKGSSRACLENNFSYEKATDNYLLIAKDLLLMGNSRF